MSEHADKSTENKSVSIANQVVHQSDGQLANQFVDNRPEAVAQRKLSSMTNFSPPLQRLKTNSQIVNNPQTVKQLKAFQPNPYHHTNAAIQLQENTEKKQSLQGKFEAPHAIAKQETTLQRFTLPASSEPEALAPIQKFVLPHPIQKKQTIPACLIISKLV